MPDQPVQINIPSNVSIPWILTFDVGGKAMEIDLSKFRLRQVVINEEVILTFKKINKN